MSTRNLLPLDVLFGTLLKKYQMPRGTMKPGCVIPNRNVLTLSALALACGAFILCLGSCKDQITDPNTNPIVFPSSNISYSQHVDPLFQQRCALSGCHAGSSAQAGLDLLTPSYSNLMNHQPQRIDGRLAPQMPYMAQPLNANQIAGIKKWIDEGAKNN